MATDTRWLFPLRRVRPFLLLLLAPVLCALAAPAAAQGGYRTETFDTLGLTLPIPRNYKAVPVEPTERWITLRWVDEKSNAREREKRSGVAANILPEFHVVWIDRVQAVTAVEAPTPPPAPDDEDPDEPEEEEEEEEEVSVTDFASYLLRNYSDRDRALFELKDPAVQKARDGNTVTFWNVESRGSLPGGFAAVFETPQRFLVLFGRCFEDDRKLQEGIWRDMASKAKLFDVVGPDMVKWERFYEKRPEFIDAAYRLEVRSKLVRGWEADDTPNYIFVYSTKDEPLLRRLKRDLEAIRLEYERLFPPTKPVTAVSTVRICRDRDEYMQYGGPPGSGGYWNWVAKELVFFDYADAKNDRGSGKKDSLIVLYHEAFHQYIFYSVGEVSPHSWYNEGTGDFFSGAQISGTKVGRIGVNPWRIGAIQDIVRQGMHVPFKDIFRFDQRTFYTRPQICYPQAWSMIYFLRTAKEVEKEPTWAQILPTYFDTLKAEYERIVGERNSEEPLTMEERMFIESASREKAIDAALDGVDVDALEAAWRSFVPTLKAP